MKEDELNKTIARVILSTKRKKRQYSLYEIAMDIQALKESTGGISNVSNIIGISPGMLNQFLSVFKLPQRVIELVKQRKIDSVSIVHHLSKYSEQDERELENLLVENKLSSLDLRILIPFRRQFPNESIKKLIEKIQSSKNIKVSVIRIHKDDTLKSLSELTSLFSNEVGIENLIAVEQNDNSIDIKLSKQGEKILRQKAKSNKTTFQELISPIIN